MQGYLCHSEYYAREAKARSRAGKVGALPAESTAHLVSWKLMSIGIAVRYLEHVCPKYGYFGPYNERTNGRDI